MQPGPDLKKEPGWFKLPAEDRPYWAAWPPNTSLEKVCRDLEEMSGLTIVGLNQLDQATKAKMLGLQTPSVMTFDEFLSTVDRLLFDINCWIVRDETYLVIRPLTEWYRNIPPSRMYASVEAYRKAKLPDWQVASLMYEPKAGSPELLANGANDTIPLSAARATIVPGTSRIELKGFVWWVNRQLQYVEQNDQTAEDGRYWVEYPLKNSTPAEASRLLQAMLASDGAGNQAGAAPRPQARPAAPGQPAPPPPTEAGSSTQDQVEVQEDNRLNRILVKASKKNQEKAKKYLEEVIDQKGPKQAKLIALQYGDPAKVVEIIRPMLGERQMQMVVPQPQGRPGHQPQPQPQPQPPQPVATMVAVSSAILTPIAATNSIFVKATPDEMTQIEEFIKMLDVKDIEAKFQYVNLTFGRANSIANILTTTLGGRASGRVGGEQQFRAVADQQDDGGIVIAGEPKDVTEALALVKQLDVDPTAGSEEHIVRLVNASATGLSDILNSRYNTGGGGPRRGGGGGGLPRFIPDDQSKNLIVVCATDQWAEIQRLIKEVDEQSATQNTTRTYKLKYAGAGNLASILTQSFGAGGGRGRYDAGGPVFQYEQQSNVLLVFAGEQMHERVAKLVKELDQPGADDEAVLKPIQLTTADAGYVAEKIQDVFEQNRGGQHRQSGAPSVPMRVVAEPISNRVLISASPEDFQQAEALAQQIDKDYAAKHFVRKTFLLEHTQSYQMVRVLQTMFPESGGGSSGYRRGGDSQAAMQIAEAGDGVVVLAPQAKMDEIEKLIKELDSDPTKENEIRTYTVQGAGSEGTDTIARNLQEIFTSDRPGRGGMPRSGSVKFIGQMGSELLFVSAPPDKMPEIDKKVQEVIKSQGQKDLTFTIRHFDLKQARPEDLVDIITPLLQTKFNELQEQKGGRRGWGMYDLSPQVTAHPTARKLMVAAPEPLMPLAEQLIAEFDHASTPSVTRFVTLKTANAVDIEPVLQQMIEKKSSSGGFSRGFRSRNRFRSWDMPSYGTSDESKDELFISVVEAGNQLVLRGPEEKVHEAEKMALELDKTAYPEGPMIRVIEVKKADAYEVASFIEDMISGGSGSSSSYDFESGYSMYGARRGRGSSSDSGSVSVRAEYGNRLFVSAPREKFPLIEQLIEEQEKLAVLREQKTGDEGDKGMLVSRDKYGEITKIYDVKGPPDEIAKSLDQILVALMGYTDAPYVKSFPYANKITIQGKPTAFKLAEDWLANLEKNPPKRPTAWATLRVDPQIPVTTVLEAAVRGLPANVPVRIQMLDTRKGGKPNPLLMVNEITLTTPLATQPSTSPFVPTGELARMKVELAAISLAQAAKITVATNPAAVPPATRPAGNVAAAAASQPASTPVVRVATRPAIAAVPVTPAPAPAPAPAAPVLAPAPAPVVTVASQPARTVVPVQPAAVPPAPAPTPVVTTPAQPVRPTMAAPAAPAPVPAAAPVAAADAGAVAAPELLPPAGNEVEIRFDPDTNMVYILGAEKQVEETRDAVENLIKLYGKTIEGGADMERPIRVFQVNYIDVNVAGAILEQMFNGTTTAAQTAAANLRARQGQPGQPQQPQPQPQQPPEAKGKKDKDDDKGTAKRRRDEDKKSEEEEEKKKSADDQIRVFPDSRTRTLVVRAAEETFPAVAELLVKIDRPGDRPPVDIQIFPLKKLNAMEVEAAIKTILKIEDSSMRMRGAMYPGMGMGMNRYGGGYGAQAMIEQLQQQMVEMQGSLDGDSADGQPGKMKLNPAKEITIASDATTNSIMVMAPEEGMKLVKKLIDTLEKQEIPLMIKSIPLKNAEAEKVATELERVFGGGGGGSSARRAASSGMSSSPFGSMMNGMMGGGMAPGSRMGELRISADNRTNTIIIRALQPDMEKIEPIVKELDNPAGVDRQVQLYPVLHGSAANMATILTKVFVTDEKATGPLAVRIMADADTNTLMVWAPPTQQALIAAKVQELEKRGEDKMVPRQLKLKVASASSVADQLLSIFVPKNTAKAAAQRLTIVGDDNSATLFITAPNEVFAEIEKVAQQLDTTTRQDIRVFTLKNAFASEVLAAFKDMTTQTMQQVRGKASDGEVFAATADARTNSLIVTGTPAVFLAVEKVLAQIDIQPGDTTTVMTAMFGLTKGSATSVAATINGLYRGQKFPSGVAAPSAVAEATSNVVYVYGTKTQLDQIKAQVIDPLEKYEPALDTVIQDYQIPIKYANVEEAAKTLSTYFQQKSASIRNAGYSSQAPADQAVTIIADPSTKQLLVTCSDKNKKLIDTLLVQIDRPDVAQTARQTKVFQLKYADINATTQTILTTLAKQGNVSESEQIKVVPEVGTNSVSVSANAENMKKVEALIADLDTASGNRPDTIPIPLKHARAEDLANILNQTYRYGRKARAGDLPVMISPDANTNALVVAASKTDMVDIQKTVAALDQPATDAIEEMRVLPLLYLDANETLTIMQEYLRKPGGVKGRTGSDLIGDIRIQASSTLNSLMVSGRKTDLDRVEQIVKGIDKEIEGAGNAPRIIKLKNQTASQMAATLTRLFSDPSMRRSGRAAGGDVVPVIMADETTNSLVVRAKTTDYNLIADMAEKLDVETKGAGAGIDIIQVSRNVDVKQMADQLARTINDGERMKAQQIAGYKPGQISIGYDDRGPALLVSGSPELFKTVRETVATLQEMRPQATNTTRSTAVIRVNNVNPTDMKRILDQIVAPQKVPAGKR